MTKIREQNWQFLGNSHSGSSIGILSLTRSWHPSGHLRFGKTNLRLSYDVAPLIPSFLILILGFPDEQ